MNKVLYIILISLFSLTVFSCAKEEEKKTEAPVLTEVYAVTTPTSDPSPNYTFSSTKAGTITYGGSCSSGTTSATSGNNTITFTTLSAGTYSDCTIIVTDSDGNASNTLTITSFTISDATSSDDDTTTSSSGRKFVAVGRSGTIISSSDGITWTSRTSGTSNTLEGVTYGISTFVAVGASGAILTSTDNGTTWTSRTSGTSNNLHRGTYGNSTFVTVGASGTILTSSDGITWTSRTSGTSNILWAVTHVNSTFLTVGDNGTILTSDNGTVWTSRTSGTTEDLWEATYGNSKFMTVGDNGTILTSLDGTTWDNRTSGTTNQLFGVTYGNGIFVVVGPDGYIYTTSDGNSLTSRTSGISNDMWGITYGNSTFVTGGYGGEILTSSDNGTTWTSRTSGTTNELHGVTNNLPLRALDNLTASRGTNTVTLDWDSVTGATSYILYWGKTTGISASNTSITSITTKNYTHSGLDNATTYYYKVAAINSSGTGTLSSEANARTAGVSASQTILGGSIQGEEIILNGKVTTFAGPPAGTTTSGSTDNATASNARFAGPIGMASDGTSFYVAEWSNNKIRKVNVSSGAVTTFAGPPAGITTAGSTDNATASNARFNSPLGITTDNGTNLYVTDASNNKIRKIVISSGAVTTFAGPPAGITTAGSTDNATASNARFSRPYGITTDGTNLYVADWSNNKIRKIVISSGAVTTFAGPPAGITTAGSTDNATASNARFNSPAGIATDGTNLYVADFSNNKIRKIVISSGEVTTLAGPLAGTTTAGDTDNDTPSNARFNGPFGITTDGINLFVSDVGTHKIRKVVISSGAVTTIAGPPAGTSGSGDTDNDTASNARFSSPYGITSDGSYIYVGDFSNNKIRRIE
jgi:hypothetical protein